MRRFIGRFAMLATALVVSFFVSACGGSGDGPTGINPPPPPPPVVTVTSIVASCATNVLVGTGTKTTCTATAYKSNSTSEDVTLKATWSSSSPSVAVVTAGVVTAVSVGSSQVTATFGGVTSTALRVDVQMPQLPTLSDSARAWMKLYAMDGLGFTWRWDTTNQIKVWASTAFKAQDILGATNFWTTASGGKIKFQIVADSLSAQIRLFIDPTLVIPSDKCGAEGSSGLDHLFTEGHGRYLPGCASEINAAHGLGHILGLAGHFGAQGNVLASDSLTYVSTPLLLEVLNWLYTVQLVRKYRNFVFVFEASQLR